MTLNLNRVNRLRYLQSYKLSATMECSVQNLVSDVDLRPSDVLLPIQEAVVNSIISLKQTENVKKEDRKIQLQITRGKYPDQTSIFEQEQTIKSVMIIDNGEGFHPANLTSYKTAHSHKNKQYGGKGIGRFTILAAFEKVEVESIYKDNGKTFRVKFDFDPINEVSALDLSEVEEELEQKTTVLLKNLNNDKLINSSARSLSDIASEIMNHCLIYYLSNDLPRIEILDEDKSIVVLNELFKNLSSEREKSFPVKGSNFNLYITKTEKSGTRKYHYYHLCANSRVVGRGRNLSKVNNLFMFPISQGSKLFFLDIYLVSDYLDEKVNGSRNGFSIPYEKDIGFFDASEITIENIEEKISEILIEEYDAFVKKTQEKNAVEVKSFINNKALQFRRFTERPEILNQIPPNLTDDKKEEFLYKIAIKERNSVDKKINEFIQKKQINPETIDAIKTELANTTAYNVDSLADYMSRRKAIIQIFKQFLEADEKGDYKLEQDIHNIIFPMGLTNSEVGYDNHNLWLLDERFATYSFISSDKSITSISQKKGAIEPDVLLIDENPKMFDNPISFASNPSGDLNSLVIFEFKRPGQIAHQKKKTDYRWDFADLIKKYFDQFIYGDDKKNFKGRPVFVKETTPKFGYVVVDLIPPQLESYNRGEG